MVGVEEGAGPAVGVEIAVVGLQVGRRLGFAAVDVGLFHCGTAAGWIGAGVSLLLLEFKVRG